MVDFWFLGWMLEDLNKELEQKRQNWQDHAIEELKEYFSLPYVIQKKYAPVYSPRLLQFFYLENVNEKRKGKKGKITGTKGKHEGDVLRTEDGKLFTIEDIKTRENI